MSNLFPMFMKLAGKQCLVVGAGKLGESKIAGLLDTGARVRVVALDVPDLCDFFYPSIVRRGDLQIAISTAGKSPSLAQKIRLQLEKQYGPAYAAWVNKLGETRKLILGSDLEKERKLELLHSLSSREAVEAALAERPRLVTKGEPA